MDLACGVTGRTRHRRQVDVLKIDLIGPGALLPLRLDPGKVQPAGEDVQVRPAILDLLEPDEEQADIEVLGVEATKAPPLAEQLAGIVAGTGIGIVAEGEGKQLVQAVLGYGTVNLFYKTNAQSGGAAGAGPTVTGSGDILGGAVRIDATEVGLGTVIGAGTLLTLIKGPIGSSPSDIPKAFKRGIIDGFHTSYHQGRVRTHPEQARKDERKEAGAPECARPQFD